MAKRKEAKPEKELSPKEKEEKRRKMTMRQKDFVREYLLCRNASEAHRRVYGSKNPDVDGPRLLGNAGIQAMIAEEEAAIQKKYEATRDEVIALLAGIVLMDPLDVLDQDRDGTTTFKKLRHMPKQARLALEIFGSTRTKDPSVILKSIRKDAALEHLAKFLGIDNGSGSGTGKDTKRAALERVRQHLAKRLGQG